MKRYSLALPADLYAEVQRIAEARHTTVVEVLRQWIKLGLLAESLEAKGGALLVRDGQGERELVLL